MSLRTTNGSGSAERWIIGTVALLGFSASVLQFVWNGSRTDIAELERRYERGYTQLQTEITELKDADKARLPLSVHQEFKQQVERQVLRNTSVVDDLLVKKEVFDRALTDQRTRDELSRANAAKELDMVRNNIATLRQQITDIVKDQLVNGKATNLQAQLTDRMVLYQREMDRVDARLTALEQRERERERIQRKD